MPRTTGPPRRSRRRTKLDEMTTAQKWTIAAVAAALVAVILMALSGCGGWDEVTQRAGESELGASAVDAAGRVLVDPTIITAIREGTEVANKLIYTLFGVNLLGAAGLGVRNHLSNRRKSKAEERIAELEGKLSNLAGNVGSLLAATPKRE